MGLKKAFNLIGAYFFRWIGFSVEPDLLEIGNPTPESPVLLTCNFYLTIKRVLKRLKGLDCYLLIAPSHGINVWCAACGNDFRADSVISIIKTSKINKKVSHRTLILPQLSAPGIDPITIKKRLGWDIKFGPVYAKSIPDYLNNNFEKNQDQSTVKFPIKKRIEMAHLYFFSLLVLFSVIYWIIAIFLPFLDFLLYIDTVLIFIIIIYGSLIILPSIRTKTGRPKVFLYGIIIFFLIFCLHIFFFDNIFYLIWNIIVSALILLVLIEDFHGLTPIYKSELGERSWKKGKSEMKVMFGKMKLQPYGSINMEYDKCVGCKMCIEVCPRNVFIFNEREKKAILRNPDKCINCNACIKRCLGMCLGLV